MKTTSTNSKSYPSYEAEDLFKAILSLKTQKEAAKFFRDLLTLPEIEEIANRWKIARLLYKGKSYQEVSNQTKTSTTTVSRVAYWLKRGTGGYRLVLDRLVKKK